MRYSLISSFAALAAADTLVEVISTTPELSSLLSVISGFPEIVEALSTAESITVLAPNNDAVGALPEGLTSDSISAALTYHVLSGTVMSDAFSETKVFAPTLLTDPAFANVTDGQVVSVVVSDGSVVVNMGADDAMVVVADVEVDNGVVHIIDKVLMPPPDILTVLTTDTTDAAANLSTLATALADASLASVVVGLSDVTVFAPNNGAFEGVDLSTLSEEDIASTLTYHVVQGAVAYSSALSDTPLEVETVQGGMLKVVVAEDGSVMVNDAKVVVADVLVANGVVHIIDGVLTPGETEANDEIDSDADSEAETDDDSDSEEDADLVSGTSSIKSGALGTVAGSVALFVIL